MFEFELPLPSLVEQTPTGAPLEVLLDGQRRVSMRCATGEDLRQWRAARPRSRDEAVATMIATLRIDGTVGPEDNPALAEAISARDPLVDFSVACECPVCGVRQRCRSTSKLWSFAGSTRGSARWWARSTGWPRATVGRKPKCWPSPPSRRARYLALIDAER